MYFRIVALLVLATGFSFAARPANAGCGCDHPPPIEGVAHPAFAWPGSVITITDTAFQKPGTKIKIDGQPVERYLPPPRMATARVVVPEGINVGPAKIEIFSQRGQLVKTLPSNVFTALPPPVPVIDADGYFYYKDVNAAVDATGTLLIPFDLTGVLDPRQFYMNLVNTPLRFGEPDMIYYNKDQFNLKLFEALFSDPNDFEWGAYYGTDVAGAVDPGKNSDVLQYWRHEFYTYRLAHESDGSHVVDSEGRHPDGSVHVDHEHLVLAIRGTLRDSSKPHDKRLDVPLKPGAFKTDVAIRSLVTETPRKPTELTPAERQLFDRANLVKLDGDNQVDKLEQFAAPDRLVK